MTTRTESHCRTLVFRNAQSTVNEEPSWSTQTGLGLYEILGVTKKATDTEIRKAYRKLALQYHPDRNKDLGAARMFRRIQYAQKVLLDPAKRQIYDKFGRKGLKLADRVGDKNVPFVLYMDTFWGRCLAAFVFLITGCGCCCLCCCCCFLCECCCRCCCNYCFGMFCPAEPEKTDASGSDNNRPNSDDVVHGQPKPAEDETPRTAAH